VRLPSRRCRCPVHFETVQQDEQLWNTIRREDMRDKSAFFRYCLSIFDTIRDTRPSAAPQALNTLYRDRLAEAVPSLAAAVFNSPAITIIAANDWVAAAYAMWLSQMGVRIPADISLLSFNNDIHFTHYPISTIDQGFANLGYRAAHVLIGDIPVRADRDGNIAVAPFPVDRGSLGRPRRGRLRTWK
jgi:hypothetical protein